MCKKVIGKSEKLKYVGGGECAFDFRNLIWCAQFVCVCTHIFTSFLFISFVVFVIDVVVVVCIFSPQFPHFYFFRTIHPPLPFPKHTRTHTRLHQSSAMYWIQVEENLLKTNNKKHIMMHFTNYELLNLRIKAFPWYTLEDVSRMWAAMYVRSRKCRWKFDLYNLISACFRAFLLFFFQYFHRVFIRR